VVKLDCRKLKLQVLDTIDKLRKDMQAHLVAQFRQVLDQKVVKNRETWDLVVNVLTDIDQIIH
jgi:tRNA C32,U32 (ribose-2'-O)-methylase TrmJ